MKYAAATLAAFVVPLRGPAAPDPIFWDLCEGQMSIDTTVLKYDTGRGWREVEGAHVQRVGDERFGFRWTA